MNDKTLVATASQSPVVKAKCVRCEENDATKKWVGEGGALALSHGWYEWWCERCVVEVQLEHAEKQTGRVDELREQLAALGGPASFVRCSAMAFDLRDGVHYPGACALPRGHGGEHLTQATAKRSLSVSDSEASA